MALPALPGNDSEKGSHKTRTKFSLEKEFQRGNFLAEIKGKDYSNFMITSRTAYKPHVRVTAKFRSLSINKPH